MNQENQKLDQFDHRRLGTELQLFHFSEYAPGMAFWLPKGAQMRKRIEDVIYRAHKARGYQPVLSPRLMDVELWKTSGHYQNYSENMFFSEVEKRENALAPMNCPGHVINYKQDIRSYKDLPMKYFEFGNVHRNEHSGALHGLFRVRSFTQDDAHIFCMEHQIQEEIVKVMEFVDSLLTSFGFTYEINFSTRPEKSIGSDEVWEKAENAIELALKELNKPYKINSGDGAFYGPKLDIKIKDNHGRFWQLSTIQIDMNLPERFDMNYIGEDGEKHRPIMIHRAIAGSLERLIGIMLEHYEGLMPIFISPYQVAIIPISNQSEKQMNYIQEIKKTMISIGADIVVYDDNNTFNKRVKTAEEDKNPIIVIIGDSEVENKSVNLRHKIKQQRYEQSLQEFTNSLIIEMQIVI